MSTTTKGISGRLDQLEKNQEGLINGLNQAFAEHSKRLDSVDEILAAVVTVCGKDEIVKVIEEARKTAEENRISKEKLELEAGVSAGYLTQVEEVDDQCVVCGCERQPDGRPVGAGWQAMAYNRIGQQFQGLFLGKKVGDKVELPTGGSFEVQSIYRLDEAALAAYRQEMTQKQVDEALAKQAEDPAEAEGAAESA